MEEEKLFDFYEILMEYTILYQCLRFPISLNYQNLCLIEQRVSKNIKIYLKNKYY